MKFLCSFCEIYVYDSEKGDPPAGAPPGVPPERLPDAWRCPVCGRARSFLKAVDETAYQDKLAKYLRAMASAPSEEEGPHDIDHYRSVARKGLTGICGEYNVCDGGPTRMCHGQKFGAPIGFGGAGQSQTFYENSLALKYYKLKTRLIKEHREPDLGTTFLGRKITAPVLPAPMSGVKNSMAGMISEVEFHRGLLMGAKAFGAFGFTGNTAEEPDTLGVETVKDVGLGVPVFKPQSQKRLLELFKIADHRSVLAIGVDLDGAGSQTWARVGKPVFRKTEKELRELVESTEKPVMFKGIMSLEDASAAVDAGAKVIGVSNHGGRVMDSGIGVADVLPAIAKEFKGKVEITADGSVRTGFDVLKIRALGANVALMGRPLARMSLAGGFQAVKMYLDYIKSDLRLAMIMTGCDSMDEVGPEILQHVEHDYG
ncbi:MAG: alpha-hydroxy-acid oxidizing protein [Methanomassiliicoccales archaeon]|nr:alpha-hydroxy-acid oxidizing protein [Methanomassiliicoccales archaeon]